MRDADSLPNARRPEQFAVKIRQKWQGNVDNIFEVALILEAAGEELGRAEFLKMVREELKWSRPMADKLLAIARDDNGNLFDCSRANLPASWDILYLLVRLPPEQFQTGLDSGVIHAGMARKDIAELKPKKEKPPTPERPKSDLPPDEFVREEVRRLLATSAPAIDREKRADFFRELRELVDQFEEMESEPA